MLSGLFEIELESSNNAVICKNEGTIGKFVVKGDLWKRTVVRFQQNLKETKNSIRQKIQKDKIQKTKNSKRSGVYAYNRMKPASTRHISMTFFTLSAQSRD